MECPVCSAPSRKFGFTRCHTQRFRCDTCKKTFTPEEKPLGVMRLPMEKAIMVLGMLLEGMSVRNVERLTGVMKRTILDLMVHVGENCRRMLNDRLKDVMVNDIEADDIWSFVGCKERTRAAKQYGDHMGDAYCFIGIERTTKLVCAWHLGKRSSDDTVLFAQNLKRATTGRFQMTTDGYAPYRDVIPRTFGGQVDFAQLIKVYGKDGVEEQRRYSPPTVIETHQENIMGSPKDHRVFDVLR